VANRVVRIHPLAAEEADVARLWYFERNPQVSQVFVSALAAAVESIAASPRRWPRVHGKYRRYLLRRFPFSIVYLERADSIDVIAVAHHRRRPGYWQER
jgi:plasmid stabilization system protein ParE